MDPRTPVIIGVGQFVDRDNPTRSEPTHLMAEALRIAEADTGVSGVLAAAEIIAVVPVVSWRYRDPGAILADRFGATAATWYPRLGGNTPQMLVNRLAMAISEGRTEIGVVTGGESYRTRIAAKRSDDRLDWSRQADDVEPTWTERARSIGHPAELAHGIVMPTQAYPMFENALWHDSGRSMAEHLAAVGEMWAGFSRVAASNPHAWRQEAYSASEITTPTPDNRMVGHPYTKRMVSNPDVDMASGLVMCSAGRARTLGVAPDRWVFPNAGTDGCDPLMSLRSTFTTSPAIGVAGNRVLELAGVSIDDVAHLDLYSCFPSAVQIAAKELGISPGRALSDRPLTVYGGLGFAGGPWNNPVGHALAAMVGVLREDPGSFGLVTANGGMIEKHAFGLYSSEPPSRGFRHDAPQDEIDSHGRVEVVESHVGRAAIEAWTVMHDRDGSLARAHAACRTPDGARVWGVTSDPDTMKRFELDDLVGTTVVIADGGELRIG